MDSKVDGASGNLGLFLPISGLGASLCPLFPTCLFRLETLWGRNCLTLSLCSAQHSMALILAEHTRDGP